MRLYSLGEVCSLLSIDPVTLRRWMRRSDIVPHVDPTDARRRYLDQAQLVQLAEAHQRVLMVSPQDSSLRLEQLCQQVDRLSQQVECLDHLVRVLLSSQHKAAER